MVCPSLNMSSTSWVGGLTTGWSIGGQYKFGNDNGVNKKSLIEDRYTDVYKEQCSIRYYTEN